MRFSDLSLHALLRLYGRTTSASLGSLQKSIPGLELDHLQHPLARGWIKALRTGPRTDSIGYLITDTGEQWITHLCHLSNTAP